MVDPNIQLTPQIEHTSITNEEAELFRQAQDFLKASKSENTLTAYKSDWKCFSSWCAARNKDSLPATAITVTLYITDLANKGMKVSTLSRRISAITKAHRLANCADIPTKTEEFREFFKGVKNTLRCEQNKKKALLTGDIQTIIHMIPDRLIGVRDKAIFLVGFAGGFRRSEIAALDVEDIEFREEGMIVTIRNSKTDQEGQGARVGIHYGNREKTCPVRALQTWLEVSETLSGPVFRYVDRHENIREGRLNALSITRIVKRCVERADLDPKDYGGHSLRAGLVTTAALNDAPISSIMKQTRHSSFDTVRGYIREGQIFKKNVSAMLGL